MAAPALSWRGIEQAAFNEPVVLAPNKATALLEPLQCKATSQHTPAEDKAGWRHAHELLNRWTWGCLEAAEQESPDGKFVEVPDSRACPLGSPSTPPGGGSQRQRQAAGVRFKAPACGLG